MFVAIDTGENAVVVALIMAGGTGTPDALMRPRIDGEIRFVFTEISGLPADKLMALVALGGKTAGCVRWIGGILVIGQVTILALPIDHLKPLGKSLFMATKAIQFLMGASHDENRSPVGHTHFQYQPVSCGVATLAILRKPSLMRIGMAGLTFGR